MSKSVRSDKRDGLIAAGKIGHSVLVFGQKVFGQNVPSITHENANIEFIRFPEDFPNLKRLVNYSLIILDYSAFDVGGVRTHEQDVFEKQIEEALGAGTTICFVHYHNIALESDPDYYRDVDKNSADSFRRSQIGFRLLEYFDIKPHVIQDRILSGSAVRNEFNSYLDKWGASHNYFALKYQGGEFHDVISKLDDRIALGFTLNVKKGKIVYLPFQRNYANTEDVTAGLTSLIDCLLTYITRSLVDLPEWALTPFFREEETIISLCRELETRLEEARAQLGTFEEAKAILFQREYVLERTVPTFIQSHLDIKTLRDEKHKEDFWILNEKDEKTVIAEVKSANKGFRKSMIYDLYNHREENKLKESFPALLVSNCNLQAGSWKDKDRVIDKQDYQVAAQNNILILRTEDLVRLWESVRDRVRSTEEVYQLFTSQCGWLEVRRDLSVQVRS